MSERFYSDLPITGDQVTLGGPEAHHLLHVMRAATGDVVTLFDGSGSEFEAVIESLRRTEVDLHIIAKEDPFRGLPFTVEIGVALPKGDRQKWLIEKLTELGVSAVVPLVTEHSVSQPTASALDRLRRTVIEACKQCGRNWLLEIKEPSTFEKWIEPSWPHWKGSPENNNPLVRRILANPVGRAFNEIGLKRPDAVQVAIGPEGGFTDAEIEAAVAAGWEKVSLGPRTLRTETAAIALASALALG